MKNGIFRMLRTCVAMMLVVVMLVSSVASAATLTLPKAIKTISEEAFMGDTSVENVVIPNGATSIGARAFKGCTNLKTVQIPDSVQSIGVDAFDGCDGVTIICSSTSEAAKYAAGYNYIEVQYTDVVEPEFNINYHQYIDTMYTGSNWTGMLILAAEVEDYDPNEDGDITWSFSCEQGKDLIDCYSFIPEGAYDQYNVRLDKVNGTGTAIYNIDVAIGDYVENYKFTVNVVETPADMPYGIATSEQKYEVGQTMNFTIGEMYFINEDGSEYTGSISMSNSNVHMENAGIEEYAIWEQGGTWNGDIHEGFRVTFTDAGVYEVPVSVHVGNIVYNMTVIVTVGSSLPSDDQFVKGACYDTLYVGYDATGNFAAATWFDEFVLYDGESIEWDVKVKEANPDTPVVNVELRETNNGQNGQLYFVGTPSEVGEVTYTVTAVVTIGDSEKAYSHEFTFYAVEVPEDAPTNENVTVPQTEYNVKVGEELSFSDADIQLVGAPEGVEWTYEYIKHVESSWMEDETVCTWYEYNEWDGYYITFLKPGTYTLRAEAKINANYSVYKDITIYVRDVAESEFDVEWTQYIDTMYIGGNGWMGNLIVRAELSGYDAEQHGEIVWNVECLEGADVFTYWTVSPEGEENTYQMRLQKAIKAGTAKYRMSVTVGDFTDSYDFTVNVIEAPADLPGGFGVAPQEYDVGDTMEFTIDDLTLLNEDGSAYTGSVKLTDANVHMELFDSSEYAFWNDSAEFINGFRGGVKVTFDKAGRYLMPVTLHVGNYIFYVDVIVYVGDGVPSDAFISQYYMYDTLYADTTSEGWLGNAYLDDYPLVSGETVEWSIAADTENPVVIVELGDTWEGDERGIDLFYSGMTGETGNVTYTVTATVKRGDEIIKSYTVDYLVKVVAKPDTLPTDANVAVSQTKYDISLEDTLTFRYDDIQLVNAPEGVEWNWVAEYDGGEWLEGDACLYGYLEDSDNDGREDGIEINFVKEGRYVLKAVANISANYRVYKDIVICVGSSLSEDVYVGSCVHTNTVFNDTDDAWFCNVNLNNFQLAQGEEVEWQIVSKENKGLVELYVNDTWDNTIYANLYVRNVSGDLGNETFTVTANVGGYSISTELTVEVIERPDELPDDGAVIVDLEKYEYEVGEEFKFDFDQISIDESVLPEEMKGKWSTDIWDTEQFDWYETGIQTKFEQAGIYSFKAVVRLASDYDISKMVYITVGDVQPEDHWNDNSTIMYAVEPNEDGNYDTDLWITDVQVTGYVAPEGVELVWEAVRTDDGNASIEIELMPGGEPNDYWCGFHAHQNGDTTGESTWKFIATAGDEVIVEKDYTITLLERDENLHIEIDIETDEYYTNVGEKFVFSCDAEYGITEDSVIREGAIVRKEIIGGTEIAEIESFEWHDCMTGFDVVFDKPGDYVFTITAYFDNIADQRDIYVHVIGGEPVVEWVDNSTVMHAVEADENGKYPEIDLWVADVNLSNYVAPEGVELVWKAERKSGVDSLNVEAWSWGGPNGYSCGFHAFQIGEQTGNSTWVFTATAGEDVIVSKEYTITLLERDESLNIGIDIDKVEFDVLAGEEFEFTIDDYDITEDSVIREGAEVRKEVYADWESGVESIEGYENSSGFKAVFNVAGDYEFSIVAFFDNIIAEKVITIHVDDSMWIKADISDPYAVVVDSEDDAAWALDNEWIGRFELMNVAEGEEIEWSVASKENKGIAVMALDYEYAEGNSIGLLVSSECATVGTETFVVTAKVGEEEITTEFTFEVRNAPDYLPTVEDMYFFESGDTFYISLNDEFTISANDVHLDNVPEDMYCHIVGPNDEDWMYDGNVTERLYWVEDVLHIKFREPGVYQMNMIAVISSNYYVEKTITIIVRESENQEEFPLSTGVPFNTLYVYEDNDSKDEWLGDFSVQGYRFEEDTKLDWDAWIHDFSGNGEEGAEPFMDIYLYMQEHLNKGQMSVFCNGMNGNTGWVDVYVKCVVDDTYTFSTIIRYNAEELPEDPMFTNEDVYVEGYEDYTINLDVNEGYTLNNDEICLQNADDSVYWESHIHDVGWDDDTAYVEWRDEGVYIEFYKEGTYKIKAVAKVEANCYLYREIKLVVGSGVSSDAYIDWGLNADRLFIDENASAENAIYFKDAYLVDTGVDEEDATVTWSIESKNGEGFATLVMKQNSWDPCVFDNGIYVTGFNGEEGTETFIVTATVNDVEVSEEIEIQIMNMPEDMPTAADIRVSNDNYVVYVGDYFEFMDHNFGFDDGSIPEGMDYVFDIWNMEELLEKNEGEFHGNGISVTFTQAGEYSFDAMARFGGGYEIGKTINITVIDGLRANWYGTMYIHEGDNAYNSQLAYVWVDGFEKNYEEGATVTWDAKIVNYGDSEEPFMSVFVEECNSGDANLKCGGMTGKTGWVEVEITCTVNGTDTYTRVIGFNAEYVTDEMPTEYDMWVESEDYYVNVGATFEYWAHKHGLDEGFGYQWESEIHGDGDPWAIEQMESFEWLEGNGFRVTFEEVGEYKFNAAVKIGANHWISRTITVHVMDLLTIRGTTMYEGKGDLWVADAYIFDYVNSEGANVEWSITPVLGEDQTECIELYFANERDGVDTIYRMISATQIENATPVIDEYTFKIKAWAGKDVLINENITVSLEEAITPTFDISVAQEAYDVGIGQEFFYSYSNFGFTEDSQFPDGANKVKEVSIPDDMWETWVNNGFEWTYDENGIRSFRVAFKEAGTYTFTVTVLVNNWRISKNIILNVGDMSTVRWDDHADRMYKNSGDDMWVTDVYIENYYLDDEIEWTLVPAEDQENPCIELYFVESFSTNTRRGIHARQLTEDTGSVTYNLTAVAADGSKVFINEDITVYLEDIPEDFLLNIWADSDIYNVAVSEEFVYTADKFGVDAENSNYPEGEHVSCEIWADDISNEYGRDFEWQDDGGFKVKFDQPGRYTFTVAVCVRNVYVTAPITIIVGDGPSLNAYVESDEVFADYEGDTWFGNVGFDNFFFSDGEKIEWSCEYIPQNSGDTPVAELYVHDIWENGLGANINVCNLTGATGEATYKVTANCGNKSWEKEITVKVIARPEEELPGNDAITVPAELIELDVGTKFSYSLEDFSFDDSTLPEGLKYLKLLWPSDVISNIWGFRHDENGFSVTFNEEGRYEFDAVVKITADYIINKTVVIVVGDGIRGDAEPYIEEVCSFGPVYPGMGYSYYGCWELKGYDILNSDEVEWTVERYTDDYSPATPGVKMRVSWVSDDRYMADLNTYDVIEQYDTEEYDMICNVNGKEIARYRVHVTVAELTEDVPTDLWVNCDTYYVHAGDEFTFTYNEFGPNGNIPEGADVRYEAWVGDDLRNQASYIDLDNGFTLTPAAGEYVFTAACWIGNYAATRDITIVVYEGDWYFDWNDNGEDSVFEMYTNLGDMYIADAYIHAYDKPEGAEIVWTAEYKDEDAKVVDIRIDLRDDNHGASINASYANEDHSITGVDTYEIVAKAVIGETETELGRHEVEIHVIEEPENMPTELWVNGDEHIWHAGDWFTFTINDFELADGEVPAGAATRKEIWINDDLRGQNGFEEFDGGFKVCVQNDGTYIFTAVYVINNRYITRDISLVVFSGDYYFDWNDNGEDSIFEMYTNHGDMYIADAYLYGYDKPEGAEIVWTAEYKDEDGKVVDIRIDLRDDNHGASINASYANEDHSITGEDTYEIVAKAVIGETETELGRHEVTINLIEEPENMPTELWVNGDEHIWHAGDWFTFTINDFELANGEVPAGAATRKEIWINDDLRGQNGFEEFDGGFKVCVQNDGTYIFTAVYVINNRYITRDISLVVFSGDYYFDWNDNGEDSIFEMYTNLGDMYIADAYLYGYDKPEGAEIVWTAEYKDEDGKVVDIRIDLRDDNHGASINAIYASEDHSITGVDTYEIVAKAVIGETETELGRHEVEIHVIEEPENMPSELWVDCETYYWRNGDWFTFTTEMFDLNNGEVPAGAATRKEIWINDYLRGQNGFEEFDGGFKVCVQNDGTYIFTAVYVINNRYVTRDISLVVFSGDKYIRWNDNTDAVTEEDTFEMYMNADGQMWVTDCGIIGYEKPENTDIEWYLEFKEGSVDGNADAQVAKLYINSIWNENYDCQINAERLLDEIGWAKYDIVAMAGETELVRRTVTIKVAEIPADIPANEERVQIESNEYYLNVGQSFDYHVDKIGLDYDGDVQWYPEIHGWGDPWAIEKMESFEWTDNGKGFHVTFDEAGEYKFFAVVRFGGNYCLRKEITITVMEKFDVISTTMYNGVGDLWVADAYIFDYALPENTVSEWSMEPVLAEGEACPLELYFENEYDGWYVYRMITARQKEGVEQVNGVYTFEIKAWVGGDVLLEETVTVNLVDPATLTFDVKADAYEYTVGVGEEFRYSYNSFGFSEDTVIPDGASKIKQVQCSEELWNIDSFEWTLDEAGTRGFKVTFDEPGVYTFDVVMRINNWPKSKTVTINVTPYGYASVNWYDNGDTLYAIEGNTHGIGAAYLENYYIEEGDSISWSVNVTEGRNLCNVVIPEGDEYWDDGRGVNLHFTDFTGETGTLKFTLTVTTEAGFTESHEFVYEVVAKPETLPTGIDVGATEYNIEPGDSITIELKNLKYTGGNVPEEDFWNYSYVDANGNDMSWDDEQKKAVLTFHNEGRYWFKVGANINNYQLEQVITVYVGITEQNYTVDFYQAFTQLYAGVTPVNDYGCWGGNMQIMNYQVLPDETLTWSLTETHRDEGVTAELYFDVEDLSKNSLANIECRNVGTGIGKVIYEVEVVSNKGFTATRTFEFTVVEDPGNLPKTLTVPFESYTVPAGSLITIRYDKFSVDGEKPDDFRYSIEGVGELPFEGRFAGDDITTPHRLHLMPEGTGTYTIRAQAICGNYVIEKNISITVTGYTQKYQDSEKLFIGDSEYLDDDFWAGLVSMVNFELQDGEEMLWNVDRISGDENVELGLYMVEGNEPEIMNVYCNNVGAAMGNVKYEVTGVSNMGYSVSYEFDFSVENLPEGLPTELYVPKTTYELKANEVCEIWYKDFSVNAEMPEGAHFYIDVTNLPDTKYYAGQGDEERLHMEPNAAGTYVIEAQMIYGNYVIGTPITIIVTE